MKTTEAAILVESTLKEKMPEVYNHRIVVMIKKSGNSITANITAIGGLPQFAKMSGIFESAGWNIIEYQAMPTGELIEFEGRQLPERGFSCIMTYTWSNTKKRQPSKPDSNVKKEEQVLQ